MLVIILYARVERTQFTFKIDTLDIFKTEKLRGFNHFQFAELQKQTIYGNDTVIRRHYWL